MRIIKLIWITLYYWNVCSFYHTPYFSQWRPHSWYGRKNSWCLKRYYGWTSSQIELRIVQWNDGEHQKLTMAIKVDVVSLFRLLSFSLKKIFLVDTFDRKKTAALVDLWWTYVLLMQHSWTKWYYFDLRDKTTYK